jgi:undecaprenyl-diphosphatase
MEEALLLSRVVHWLQQHERRLFVWVNHRIQHTALDFILSRITHLGGATFTVLLTLSIALFADEPWSQVGWQSLIALGVSHIPVAIIKRMYPRLRPYLVLPDTHVGKNPLTDHSFPSGHTTAIFSIVLPFMVQMPLLSFWLLPIALTVSMSRIYLGLHYPSDCVAGSLIGTGTALASVAFIG